MAQYNSNVPLLGLVGRKRSGKDTFAAYTGFHKVALADPLREVALGTNPIISVGPGLVAVRLQEVINEIGWEQAKDQYPEVRGILQRLGTEGVRAIDPQFWVREAARRIIETRDAGMPVVVTDVRYPNEIDMIKNLGGTTVRIRRGADDLTDLHPSETALDQIETDFDFSNEGSLFDLEETALGLVDLLTIRWTAANAA